MIVDELIKLQQTKAAIKQALIDKGQNPTDEFASYADDISRISGGSNPPSDILNMLGYTSTNAPDLYNALLNSLEERDTYENNTAVLLPKLTLDEGGVYRVTSNMFKDSTILTVPKGKYSCVTYSSMFQGCTSLLWIPDMEFSTPSNDYPCAQMFSGCTALRTVGNLNTKGCNSAYHMFKGCTNLESIASLDTSNVDDMSYMFYGCAKLKSIPQLDTSNVTTMGSMFDGCTNLKSIPQLDTSKVAVMSGMFSDCSALESLPQLDTSKVTSMILIFQNCPSIEKITSLDVRAVTSNSYITGFSGTIKPLKYMLLKNLGQSTATSWGLGSFTNWGINDDKYPDARQSLIDTLITYSYDRVGAGMSTCTIKLSSTTKGLLTEDEIAQITAKGFTIS